MVMFESLVAFVSTLIFISETNLSIFDFNNIASLCCDDTDIKIYFASV